jgi:hypothetical protein
MHSLESIAMMVGQESQMDLADHAGLQREIGIDLAH